MNAPEKIFAVLGHLTDASQCFDLADGIHRLHLSVHEGRISVKKINKKTGEEAVVHDSEYERVEVPPSAWGNNVFLRRGGHYDDRPVRTDWRPINVPTRPTRDWSIK